MDIDGSASSGELQEIMDNIRAEADKHAVQLDVSGLKDQIDNIIQQILNYYFAPNDWIYFLAPVEPIMNHLKNCEAKSEIIPITDSSSFF